MTPLGQIVRRNLTFFDLEKHLLWINPPADESWQLFAKHPEMAGLHCQNFRTWETISEAGGSPKFAAFPDLTPCPQVLLSLPHSKAKLEMMLDCCAAILSEGGKLWLAGENRAGIRSAGSKLKQRFEHVTVLDSARHCRLYEASHPISVPGFDPEKYRHCWKLGEEFDHLELCSWPGVFAHGKLDEGTRLLLEVIPSLTVKGNVLDFGCGSGVVSASLHRHHGPLALTLVDVDALALLSAETTLALNDIKGDVIPGDGLTGIDKQFDLVISNPPFHEGHLTDTQLSMKMMDPKGNYLTPGGSVVVVVNRHLRYTNWLEKTFGKYQLLAENNRYQVLQATRTH